MKSEDKNQEEPLSLGPGAMHHQEPNRTSEIVFSHNLERTGKINDK